MLEIKSPLNFKDSYCLKKWNENRKLKWTVPSSINDLKVCYPNIRRLAKYNYTTEIGYDPETSTYYALLKRLQQKNRYSEERVYVSIMKTESKDFFEIMANLDKMIEKTYRKQWRIKNVSIKSNS